MLKIHYQFSKIFTEHSIPYQSPGNRRQCAVFAFPLIKLSTSKHKE